MYVAQHTADSAASPTPRASISPCHGSVSRTTPTRASAGHTRERRSWLRATATPSGPRNSIATAVPSGIRATADRNAVVSRPVATPRASTTSRSRRPTPRSRGRVIPRKISAPMVSRSQAVPAGPTESNRCVEYAAPSWTEIIAATARDQAGTRVLTAEASQPRTAPRPAAPAGEGASTWRNGRSGTSLSDRWTRYSRGGGRRGGRGQSVKEGSQRSARRAWARSRPSARGRRSRRATRGG